MAAVMRKERGAREAARVVRAALKAADLSPENFALAYPAMVWGASGRTIRRWADGEAVPDIAVVGNLYSYTRERA